MNRIRDPEVPRAEPVAVRYDYNAVRLHAQIGYVTPADKRDGRDPASVPVAGADPVRPGSPTIDYNAPKSPRRSPAELRNSLPDLWL